MQDVDMCKKDFPKLCLVSFCVCVCVCESVCVCLQAFWQAVLKVYPVIAFHILALIMPDRGDAL